MNAAVPGIGASLAALLRAELASMLRNRRGILWVLVFPPLAMVAGVAISGATSGPERLAIAASAMTVGTFAQGLFGHANAMAVARERGVLVRLRCTPAATWVVLLSRGLTQVALGLTGSAAVLLLASTCYGVRVGPEAAVLALPAVVAGALTAWAVGQLIAALARSAAEVSAVSRLAFFALFILGDLPLAAPHLAAPWKTVGEISPFYLAWRLSTDALAGSGWSPHDGVRWALLLLTAAATGWAGVRWFRWAP